MLIHNTNTGPEQKSESKVIPSRGFYRKNIKSFLSVGLILTALFFIGHSARKDDGALLPSLKSTIVSFLHTSSEKIIALKDKLSTAPQENTVSENISSPSSLWEMGKSKKGDSIWKIYRESVASNEQITFKTQTINGLKNITLLKNEIPHNRVQNNSLGQDEEYSFIGKDAQMKYAGKVTEANEKLQGGAQLKDLDASVRLAYLVANAPSYEFLYSLPAQDVQSLLE